VDLPCDPAIAILDLYPQETESTHHRDTYSSILFAALFTIKKIRNQPRCPSVVE
jgi:hypothetical protein